MTNAQIFRAAADYIRKHGWMQFDWGTPGGPACTSGAVRFALGYGRSGFITEEHKPAVINLCERINSCTGDCVFPCNRHQWPGVGKWNDAPTRTAEEVLALLDGLAFDEELAEQAKAASLEPAKEPVAV